MDNTMHGTTFGDQASAIGDQVRGAAASATEKIGDQVEGGVNVARKFAHQASETLEGATRYFRETDSSKMADDLAQYVKSNPLPAIAGAAVLGFVVGRMFRRD